MKNQNLGDRMKENYENRFRYSLPSRTYTLIRIDGKAFHSYTKGLNRPFDDDLINDMDSTAAYLCKNIMVAKLAFVQSDEISILLTDFEEIGTQSWFDNNLQKMCSVSASMATSMFNRLRYNRYLENKKIVEDKILIDRRYEKEPKLAEFDSRVFQIPQKIEVENYFIFRQQDTVRNSISSVAQSLYSHKELNNKNCDQMQEMIFQKGINWNNYESKYKRGRLIIKENYEKEPNIIRSRWVSVEVPIFTQNRNFLSEKIPNNF